MNVRSLKNGLVLKNYKEWCEVFDMPVVAGNAKKAQFKELEQYCNFHKEGQKIIIDEVYEVIKRKVDKRVDNGKYALDVEQLIIHECSLRHKNGEYITALSKNALLLKLGLINKNFSIGMGDMVTLSNYMQIPIETISDFFSSATKNYTKIIEGALKRLQNQCLIFYSHTIVFKYNNEFVIADDAIISVLKEAEKAALNELGLTKKNDLFYVNKWSKFKDLVRENLPKVAEEILQDEKSSRVMKLIIEENLELINNYSFYYNAYKIVTTKDFRAMLLEHKELIDKLSKLNNESINSCKKSIESRVEYAKKLAEENEELTNRTKNKLSEDYTKDTEKIIDTVIKENIKIDLEKELMAIEARIFVYTNKDKILDSELDKIQLEEEDRVWLDEIFES